MYVLLAAFPPFHPPQHIDSVHERLFYACSALALPKRVAAVHAAAVAAQAAAFDAAVAAGTADVKAAASFLQPQPTSAMSANAPVLEYHAEEASTLEDASAAGRHHHHHHHHHRRQLLQNSNGELMSPWLVSCSQSTEVQGWPKAHGLKGFACCSNNVLRVHHRLHAARSSLPYQTLQGASTVTPS